MVRILIEIFCLYSIYCFSIITIDGDKYGQIYFNKGLIRYASDRFLDIELVTNTVVGLKIPLTSIVTKDFYVIPSRMATTQDNQTGFTLYEGKNKTTFKNVSISGKTVGGVFRYNSIFFVLIKYFNTAKNRIAFINTVYSLQGICLSDHIFFTGIRIDQGIPFLK